MQRLLVFAKRPQAGQVKTRLCPPLFPEQAAELYEAMLADALAQYADLGVPVALYVAGDAEDAYWQRYRSLWQLCRPQRGADLGARMLHAFQESFAEGAEQVVVIGTDHPTLPSSTILHAFDALETDACDVVIGPSNDGGYYLLGMTEAQASLFNNMPWSTEAVLPLTLQRLQAAALRVHTLPPHYDIDTSDDLHRLHSELASARCQNTRVILQNLPASIWEP